MFESGEFFTGANYWASHAGTAMWRDWRAEVVAADMKALAAQGVTVLRVFPLWPDFQPIRQMYGGGGQRVEMRIGEKVLADTGAGFSGVDEGMLERFRFVADRARENGITLIVGLVTGWMSGRLFVPPALEGRNPITDPVSRMWQVRFVKTFVSTLKDHPAIGAWDLGNECNCMGQATREEAWAWTAGVADAIRSMDPSRPVVSGMHSLRVDPEKPWSMRDQGELTDILTTHPYPRFTPHASLDPVGTLRTSLHAAAETRLYSDLGRRPAFIEEAGTLGPAYGDAERARAHLRCMLYSGFMENERGLLWWCAFDQDHLEEAPYDWNAVERELGLFTKEGKPKLLVGEFAALHRFRKSLPVRALPSRLTDAVCILGPDQDPWGVALGSYLLAAQAGLSLRFAWGGDEIPDSPTYFMPSVDGACGVPRRTWVALKKKVEAGAVLYISVGDGIISGLEALAGVEIIHQGQRTEPASVRFGAEGFDLTLPLKVKHSLRATRATVLAREADGNPAMTVCDLGKGKVFFSTLPVESHFVSKAGAYGDGAGREAWRIWRLVAKTSPTSRVLQKTGGGPVLVTEHPIGEGQRIALCLNVAGVGAKVTMALPPGWEGSSIGEIPAPVGWAVSGGQGVLTLEPWGVAAIHLKNTGNSKT